MTTTTERILVVGATGMLGEPVARQLAADGHYVHVLSRSKEKAESLFANDDLSRISSFEGNVDDLGSLQEAMKGCTGIHINLSGGSTEADGTKKVIQAANGFLKAKEQKEETMRLPLNEYP